MINKWNFQTPTEEELHKRDALAAEIGFSPVICLLLVQRGITTAEEARKFFKPNLKMCIRDSNELTWNPLLLSSHAWIR